MRCFMFSCFMKSWPYSGWWVPAPWGRRRCSRLGFSSSWWSVNSWKYSVALKCFHLFHIFIFVFNLQTKSMAHHLFLTSKLETPRRQRFPDRFVDDIAALVCAVSADIASRYHKVKIWHRFWECRAVHQQYFGIFEQHKTKKSAVNFPFQGLSFFDWFRHFCPNFDDFVCYFSKMQIHILLETLH